MTDKYILDGHKAVPEPDLLKWGKWFESCNRTVKKDRATISFKGKDIGFVEVSTIFLGLDHRFGEGDPLLFETMILGGPLDQEMDRCSTWEAAEKMHEKMCERVKANII